MKFRLQSKTLKIRHESRHDPKLSGVYMFNNKFNQSETS